MIRINLWHHWFSLYKLRDFENTHSNTDHHSRTSLVYSTIILRKSTRESKWPTTVSTVNIQSEQNNRGSNATAALNGTTELATLAFPNSNIVLPFSKRGRPKLVDNRGYSYNIQRRRGENTDWQCTVRPKVYNFIWLIMLTQDACSFFFLNVDRFI